jgi:hypothetical protein
MIDVTANPAAGPVLQVASASGESDADWDSWPEPRKRQRALMQVATALDAIDALGRAPDHVETLDLKSALAAIEGRMYTAALTFARRAQWPSDPLATPLGESSIDTQALRLQLDTLKSHA